MKLLLDDGYALRGGSLAPRGVIFTKNGGNATGVFKNLTALPSGAVGRKSFIPTPLVPII